MCGERAHHPRGSHVPEEDGFVVGAADKHVALGRECEGVDVIMVANERGRICFTLRRLAFAALSTSKTVLTVEMSQSRMDLSSEPDARVFESGLQAMVEMPAMCPSRMCSCLPLVVSHILMVASAADHITHQPTQIGMRWEY